MALLACLFCGGSGVVKVFENVAGDFHWMHCPMCLGTGKQEYPAPEVE